uniref:Macaca fascicularis brain cDNA clone: QflA-17336, similar to human KIAA1674 (KIAA1674), mRNA, RefSeq: XM_290462.4 n=1 Tax=Macaca fascicularis TaxID=9541 RepID=I7GMK8_MACFA|nr:unnamed protein product [Macaca fascicularis]
MAPLLSSLDNRGRHCLQKKKKKKKKKVSIMVITESDNDSIPWSTHSLFHNLFLLSLPHAHTHCRPVSFKNMKTFKIKY